MGRRTPEEEARRAAIREAKRLLQEAEEAHRERVRAAMEAASRSRNARERTVADARRQLERTRTEHKSRLARLEREVRTATDGELLASYSNVHLYNNRLEAPEGTVPLSSGIRLAVEVSGEKTKDADNREVLLLLETPKFDSVVRCPPAHTAQAREFAALANTAAKNADERVKQYEERRGRARQTLEHARTDLREIEQAEALLAASEADTEEVDQAEAALAAAQADTAVIESRREQLLALDPTAKIRSVKEPRAALVASRPALWWRDRSRLGKAGLLASGSLLTLLALLIAIGSVVGTDQTASEGLSETQIASVAKAEPTRPVELAITSPGEPVTTVHAPKFTLRGFATSGSDVTVNGETVLLRETRFTIALRLKRGENAFEIQARKQGFEPRSETITITRRLPPLELVITRPSTGTTTVREPSYTVAGRATAGSKVRVGGESVLPSGNRFEVTVQLSEGKNVVSVRADKKGFASRYIRFTIVRQLSQAEIVQRQEARRQTFINSTRTIPYNQLIKNPQAYAGTKVRYYGEILQIQEDPTGDGIMLLYVTDLGYDIWADQIWVNYKGHVRSADGDQITVYGLVLGSRSYETQIGGETYVPEVDAVYIDE